MNIDNYSTIQSGKGYKLKKIYSYKISIYLYNIYILEPKTEAVIKNKEVTKLFKLKSNETSNGTSDEMVNCLKFIKGNNNRKIIFFIFIF